MKLKIFNKRIVITIASLIAGYIIIVPIALWIMAYSSMMTQADYVFLEPFYVEDSGAWMDEVMDGMVDVNWGHLQFYDTDGTLQLDSYDPNEMSTNDYYFSADHYVKYVAKGHVVQKISAAYDSRFKLLRVIYVYGIPVYCGDQVVGAAFNIHSPLYFSQTLRTFLLLFSAAYLIAAVSVTLILIMHRKYENDRQTYIANVTHALKTPVTAIKALAESLCDDEEPDPDEQRFDLQLILKEADTQVEMVNNILSLSRIQTKRQNIKKRRVTAAELIKDPVKKHIQQCRTKNIDLVMDDSIDNFNNLLTDPDAVRQIMDVLLDNAVKFAGEGGNITVSVKNLGRHAVISVRDDGIGIEKENLNKVFNRFYTTPQGNGQGTGLGLAIAKELSDSLRERIWIESKPGEGTEIFFTVKMYKT